MLKSDPFISKAFVNVLKYMEMRWGLTLVSFLPSTIHQNIVKLQKEISNLWIKCSEDRNSLRNFYFEFYHPSHLHCTHLTLMRSDPCGPVKSSEFVKPNQQLFELFNIISDITSKIQRIEVLFDRITLSSKDGIGLILLGQCNNEESIKQRVLLLKTLNLELPKHFSLSIRDWDDKRSKFHELHICIGFQKRQVPQEYDDFFREIRSIEFNPISVTLEEVSLVHHRFRTLAFPQEGIFIFPFGKRIEIDKDEFSRKLNLD